MPQVELTWPRAKDGQLYGPLPKQRAFLDSSAKYRAYFGGFRSGKSVVGCMEVLLEALRYPNNRILVGRLTYDRLRDTTQQTFFEICPETSPLVREWNKTENRVTLFNGSDILFRHLDTQMGFRGVELGAFYIDEASEIDEYIYDQLCARLSKPDSSRRGWLTTNVAGHNWLWRRFVYDRKPETEAGGSWYALAPTGENYHLPADYEAPLRQQYTRTIAARYLDASFEAFEGQAFEMFHRDTHVFDPSEVTMERHWWRARGIDHGLANPMCCLWFAVDDNKIRPMTYCYREYYQTSHALVAQNCTQIRLRDGGDPPMSWTVIDPTVTKRDPNTGRPILSGYVNAGIACALGNNDRPAGLLKLMELLSLQSDGQPLLKISAECRHLIEDITTAVWNEDPDDVRPRGHKTQKEDIAQPGKKHALDAARYWSLQLPPLKIAEPHEIVPPHFAEVRELQRQTEDRESLHPVLGRNA